MIQMIDAQYFEELAKRPNGFRIIADMSFAAAQRTVTAEAIAMAVINEVAPLRQRVDQLLAANTALVQEKRDQRFEMQAELDAAHAELDEWRSGRAQRKRSKK